jgi:hypothetical protein
MCFLKGKYTISQAVNALVATTQVALVLMLIVYINLKHTNVIIKDYTILEQVVTTSDEEFLIRNSYLSLKFNKDKIVSLTEDGNTICATVIGINLFNGIIKRRIIDGKDCRSF